jgi:ligand-binding sensor domain-containing protein
MTVETIALGGTNAGDFALGSGTCAANTNVTASGNCTIPVSFTPSATGIRSATLTVTTQEPDGTNPQTLTTTLTGTGITTVSSILIDPITPANVFAGLDGAGIYRSTDSGGSWSVASLSPVNTRIKALAITPGDSTKLFAATYGGGVYKSTDSGVSWSACTNTGLTNTNVLSLVTDSSGKLYAGTEAGVFTSTDSCASWTAQNTGLP